MEAQMVNPNLKTQETQTKRIFHLQQVHYKIKTQTYPKPWARNLIRL